MNKTAKRQIGKTSTRISNYLKKNGSMSSRDICNDLGFGEVDLELAYQLETEKQRPRWYCTFPLSGGFGSWFRWNEQNA